MKKAKIKAPATETTSMAAKKRLLTSAITKLKKQYGEEFIVDSEKPTHFDVISSGSMLFDKDTGIGGLPRGRLVEIFGEPGSGKTSMVSSLCANAQKQYPELMVLIIDTEGAVDVTYMETFGVDVSKERFMLVQPESIEEALTIMETMMETEMFSMIALDSVGASLTLDQMEKGMDENTMGSLAKRMSVGSNKIKNMARKTNTLALFVNQIYSSMNMYGSPTETKGGKALKFASSIRVQIAKRDLLQSSTDKEVIIGQNISYKFIKNKVGRPFIKGETFLYFGKGFDKFAEIIELAMQYELINRAGAWYKFNTADGEEMSVQGKDRVVDFLTHSPTDFDYYETEVRKLLENKGEAGEMSEEEIEKLKVDLKEEDPTADE